MDWIDLHVHSSASDGTLSPSEVTRLAFQTGLRAYALTDHDTISGIDEAVKAADGCKLEVIAGIELSCPYKEKEIHILGLYIDSQCEELKEALSSLRAQRRERNEALLLHFNRDGFPVTKEDLIGDGDAGVITRAHFARALLKKGCVSSMDQAFRSYLDQGKKYYLPKKTIPPREALRLIRRAGGFPALAHPLQYKLGWKMTEELILSLKEQGLAGVEAYYSSHTLNDCLRLRDICRRHGLLPTGGSDFHGDNKPDIKLGRGRGRLYVPISLLEDIKMHLREEVIYDHQCQPEN